MTSPPEQLDQLQHWVLAAITQPGAGEPADLAEVILPSRQQSAAERLAVYQNAYWARLLAVLRELFPCTRFAVGDELFDQFAAGYLQAHPPHSYTLDRLADKLAEYLDASRPTDWGEFVVELCQLEQAIDRIFDGPGPEQSPPFGMPASPSASLKLTFVPGCELHAFRFPVSTYYSAWKAGRQPQWPEQRQQFVALLRRDFIVRRYELSETQYHLLSALQGGSALGEALTVTAEVSPSKLDDLATDCNRWFAFWAAERFFAAAE